jgi:hypothetical protein
MKKKQWIITSIVGVFVFALISSGWIYSAVKLRDDAKVKELETLQSTFNQQYGTDGITVTQMISPDKVYVAVWTSKDGTTNVSWNIGGLWVTVFSSLLPENASPIVTP